MAVPLVRLELPDGVIVDAAPEGVVGRSPIAVVRVDDPRVSTVHAELSWRAPGFVLIARGGRIAVAGRPAAEVVLTPGLVVELAPGLGLRVRDVLPGDAPVVPPTAGREHLRFRVDAGVVRVFGAAEAPLVELGGIPAALFTLLLDADGAPRPWDALACALWPDEGRIRAAGPGGADAWTDVDERRLRNRFDQHLVVLRRALEPIRGGGLVRVHKGHVEAVLGRGDRVERG